MSNTRFGQPQGPRSSAPSLDLFLFSGVPSLELCLVRRVKLKCWALDGDKKDTERKLTMCGHYILFHQNRRLLGF